MGVFRIRPVRRLAGVEQNQRAARGETLIAAVAKLGQGLSVRIVLFQDRIDRALRARYRDEALRGLIVRFLAGGALDQGLYERISQAADQLLPLEHEARRLAKGYQVDGKLALLDAREARRPYDKTLLLLLGQRCARVSLVHDAQTLTVAARFDSGIDLLDILGLHGGMPTVVSLHAGELERVVSTLRQRL